MVRHYLRLALRTFPSSSFRLLNKIDPSLISPLLNLYMTPYIVFFFFFFPPQISAKQQSLNLPHLSFSNWHVGKSRPILLVTEKKMRRIVKADMRYGSSGSVWYNSVSLEWFASMPVRWWDSERVSARPHRSARSHKTARFFQRAALSTY